MRSLGPGDADDCRDGARSRRGRRNGGARTAMSGDDRYLLAVYILEHRREPPIESSAVAELLDVSQASATEMFQRLDDRGLVTYESYAGATPTDAGRERADSLHETYVTVSWFYRSVLDLDSHEAEAMELAGLVSPSVVERLASTLPHEDAAMETVESAEGDRDDSGSETDSGPDSDAAE
ncbi:iron-dependent repressor [Halarchaeum acidiphilum MH1-52-1]|uniref:Iron-dependent repressor n=1 Tax=Halarchaeum acidiphilum MH1-52-1 TaxID=1261545 RepID=U3ACM8_9EURY|nr:iron-dependent repressor [Halarchaeum acidiphilum MH1-52-1]